MDGAATDWRRERLPWFVAGILIITGLSWIAFKGINRNAPGAPDMANVGSAGSQQGAPAAGGPPDISTMSPAERFNRDLAVLKPAWRDVAEGIYSLEDRLLVVLAVDRVLSFAMLG